MELEFINFACITILFVILILMGEIKMSTSLMLKNVIQYFSFQWMLPQMQNIGKQVLYWMIVE